MGVMRRPGDHGESDPPLDALSRQYEVKLRFSVQDLGLLWRMAAAHMLSLGDYTGEDVVEMLGPMEDPSVADCIAIMAGPPDLAGCCCEEFSVVGAGAAVGPSARNRPVTKTPGGSILIHRLRSVRGGVEAVRRK